MSELLRAGRLPEGTAVTADFQEAGRGQQGAIWESDHGKNLLVSILFYPVFLSVERIFSLNMMTSLALHDALKEMTGIEVSIKWPNDIYCRDRKLAGILLENSLQGESVRQSVIGIGLNVNQTVFSDRTPSAVSLAQLTGSAYEIEDVYSRVAAALERRYLQLRNGDHMGVNAEYLDALYRRGEWHHYRSETQEFRGRIEGVDDFGRLVIAEESGVNRTFGIKQVEYL